MSILSSYIVIACLSFILGLISNKTAKNKTKRAKSVIRPVVKVNQDCKDFGLKH